MKNFDINMYGSHTLFTWSKEYLYKLLTTGKHKIIKTPNLRNAFKIIDRKDFLPLEQQPRAYEDIDLTIDFGCVVPKPTTSAFMLQLIEIKFNGRYLDIGTGSGYIAALMAIAGGEDSVVYSLERDKFMIEIAKNNAAKYPQIKNLKILFRDGTYGMSDMAPFDAIHASVSYERIPEELIAQLKIGGKLVVPTINDDLRLFERVSEYEFKETIHKGYFFDKIQEGLK